MTPVPGRAWFTVAEGVAVEADAGLDGRVYAAILPDGPLLCLEGTAAVIWREAVAAGSSTVAARVAARVGIPPDEVEPDVDRFLTELVERGLLVERSR